MTTKPDYSGCLKKRGKAQITNLTEKIEGCRGVDKCFGKKFPTRRRIVFSMEPKTMRVMVVTEQPKGIRTNKADLKKAFDRKPRDSVPRRLVELLGDGFSQNIKDENGLFYWTHFIKCPGEFRDERGVEEDKCADTWLWQEMESLKPLLIISIGSMTNRWLFEQVQKRFKPTGVGEEEFDRYERDWREYLWREATEEYTAKLRIGDNAEATIICLFHPSERSGTGWFIDRKLKPLVQRSIEEVKNSIR